MLDKCFVESAVPLFHPEMEHELRVSGVDCCMVLGKACPSDKGTACFLLDLRWLNVEVPKVPIGFCDFMFSRLPKKGWENHRVGGSSGLAVATSETMKYWNEHAGSSPRKTIGCKLIPDGHKWHTFYMSPYESSPVNAAKHHVYSQPQRGGQIRLDNSIVAMAPAFFAAYTFVRVLSAPVCQAVGEAIHQSIVPEAVAKQEAVNRICIVGTDGDVQDRAVSLLKLMNWYRYTLVAHAMGKHVDTGTKLSAVNCPGFIENKVILAAPERSTNVGTGLALGRGGAGPGVFAWAIVDHHLGNIEDELHDPGYGRAQLNALLRHVAQEHGITRDAAWRHVVAALNGAADVAEWGAGRS